MCSLLSIRTEACHWSSWGPHARQGVRRRTQIVCAAVGCVRSGLCLRRATHCGSRCPSAAAATRHARWQRHAIACSPSLPGAQTPRPGVVERPWLQAPAHCAVAGGCSRAHAARVGVVLGGAAPTKRLRQPHGLNMSHRVARHCLLATPVEGHGVGSSGLDVYMTMSEIFVVVMFVSCTRHTT